MSDAGAKASTAAAPSLRPLPEPRDPLEFLARSWSASAADVARALHAAAPAPAGPGAVIAEDVAAELDAAGGSSFSFASAAATSQLVVDRIMGPSLQQQDVSPLTSGRPSHSSGPLNGGGSISDSQPVSPDTKFCRAASAPKPPPLVYHRGGSKTMGRWLKDRRERRKEEARAQNAQVHAAVSVAAVAASVAAVAAATAAASSSSGKDDRAARADAAVASAATLVAAQCVEAAEAMGAERDRLAAAVRSAVNVRTPGDVVTVTAAAATALRCSATLKARAQKEAWNVAAVIPVEKGGGHLRHGHRQQFLQLEHRELEISHSGSSSFSDDLGVLAEENNTFLGNCTLELLARGTQLLKRTRKGALHWKVASAYINRNGLVMLKMKSKHVGGTITKKKKSVVVDLCRDVAAWPGRHLLEGGEHRRYFGLRTAEGRVIEFECAGQMEYDMWTKGVARLLGIVDNRKRLGA